MDEIYIVYTKILFALLASFGVLRLTIKLAPRIYTIRFISGYYTFQFAALLVFLIVLPDSKVWNADFPNLILAEYINEIIFAYLLFQIGVLFAVLVGTLFLQALKKRPSLTDYIKLNAKYVAPPLVFCAAIIFLYPFLSFRPGIGYAVSILFNFTKFLPFAAGVLFFHNARLRVIWIIALATLFLLGILTGGRGTAIVSGFLYFVGFYYALSTPRAKMITLVSAVVIAIPFASFFAFVGIFRHMVGRVDFSKINWERAVSIYQKYEKVKDIKALDLNSQDAQLQGWGRFVNFVNVVQFATIPSKKPHLGVEGLFTVDLPYSYDISFLSGTTLEDRLRAKAGNFRLNDYGYNVTLSSSVEYSLVTEGYIRFGFPGVFLFAFTISLFSQFMELVIYLISRKNSALYVFATLMVSLQAMLGYAYNLFAITRSMILAVMAAIAIVLLIKVFRAIFKFPARRVQRLPNSGKRTVYQ